MNNIATKQTARHEAPLGQVSWMKNKYKLFMMALPLLALAFVFSHLPLYGWVYSFFDYRPGIPLKDSEFMGFYWFTSMFSSAVRRQEIIRVMTNTFAMSGLSLLTSVLPVAFAIFLTEIRSTFLSEWCKR